MSDPATQRTRLVPRSARHAVVTGGGRGIGAAVARELIEAGLHVTLMGREVNNAGAAESAPFERTDAGMLDRMLAVNLTGTFLCCRAVLPGMREAGWGRIVNVASTAGLKGYAYVSAYCAAKHGVVGLTRSLALETARDGVTVNAVCPGYTDTDMTRQTLETIRTRTGRDHDTARDELVRHNPQGRLVDPREVAEAVAWLCEEGSAAVTGQAIAVAGGEVM
jgi:NAD(P)-dependent dehydrogenase (short-subunit alcohol dehydrogenase family)